MPVTHCNRLKHLLRGVLFPTPLHLVQSFVVQESMIFGLSIFFMAAATVAPVRSDPCAAIAGTLFATPAESLACLRSFPFNETLRQNVLSIVSRVFDFYTFEDYYPNTSPPFQNMVDIRAELARIESSSYSVSSCSSLDLSYN